MRGEWGNCENSIFLINRAPPKPEIPEVTTKPVHSMYQNNANSNGSRKNSLMCSSGLAEMKIIYLPSLQCTYVARLLVEFH